MELSNRAFGLLFATGMLAIVAVPTESASSTFGEIPPPTNAQISSEAATPTGEGQATLRMVSDTPQQTFDLGLQCPSQGQNRPNTVARAEPLIRHTQPAQPEAVQPDLPRATPDFSPSDSTSNWADDQPVSQPSNYTDRQILDTYLGVLNDNDRSEFRMVWTGMTQDDRQAFMSDLTGTSGGN